MNAIYNIEERFDQIEKLLEKALLSAKADEPPRYLTIEEAADLICKSVHTVYGLVSRRQIPHIKKGNRLYFREDELRAWLEQGERPTVNEMVYETKLTTFTKGKKSNPKREYDDDGKR